MHKREEEWNGEMELMCPHYEKELWGTSMRMDNIYEEIQHNIKLKSLKKKHLQKL